MDDREAVYMRPPYIDGSETEEELPGAWRGIERPS